MSDPKTNPESLAASENEANLLDWEKPEAVSLSVSRTYYGNPGPNDGTHPYT